MELIHIENLLLQATQQPAEEIPWPAVAIFIALALWFSRGGNKGSGSSGLGTEGQIDAMRENRRKRK